MVWLPSILFSQKYSSMSILQCIDSWGKERKHVGWNRRRILSNIIWLVVWNINFIFPYIGNNHPNWRTHIFQRGGWTTNQIWYDITMRILAFIIFHIRLLGLGNFAVFVYREHDSFGYSKWIWNSKIAGRKHAMMGIHLQKKKENMCSWVI